MNLIKLMSLLSLGDSYEIFLKQAPVSTLTERSLTTVAKRMLHSRGIFPDTSSDALTPVVEQLKEIADKNNILNLADLLQNQNAAKVFFGWASNPTTDSSPVPSEMVEGLAGLNNLQVFSWVPDGTPEDAEKFETLMKEMNEDDRFLELAGLTYNHAFTKQLSIREFLTTAENRTLIKSMLMTCFGREPGFNPLTKQDNVLNSRCRRGERRDKSSFAITW